MDQCHGGNLRMLFFTMNSELLSNGKLVKVWHTFFKPQGHLAEEDWEWS